MTKSSYENKVITEPVMTDHVLTGMSIGTWQPDYPLREADFLRLKSDQSSMTAWALNFFFATVGYAISLGPKWIAELTNKSEQVSKGEWTTLAIGVIVSVILYLIGLLLPNDKKKTMKKIEDHFKNAPTSRQIIRSKE